MTRSIDQKESATQTRVVRLFTESLGYTNLGHWSDRPDNRNIKPALLRAFLLAQGVDAALANRAIFHLEQTANDRVKQLQNATAATSISTSPESGSTTIKLIRDSFITSFLSVASARTSRKSRPDRHIRN